MPEQSRELSPYFQWQERHKHKSAYWRYKFSPPATDRAPTQLDGRPTFN